MNIVILMWVPNILLFNGGDKRRKYRSSGTCRITLYVTRLDSSFVFFFFVMLLKSICLMILH